MRNYLDRTKQHQRWEEAEKQNIVSTEDNMFSENP